MGGFGDAIKYLYERFVLRDMLSFVIPGAIVTSTAFILAFPYTILEEQFSNLFQFTFSIPWLLYIPLFGFFYMVGFAIQCLGEFFGLIRIHRAAKSSWRQRFRILWCGWDNESNIWWKEAHKDTVSFHSAIRKRLKDEEGKEQYEWARLQQERLVVLKQMCANGFLASVLGAIFLIFRLLTNTVITSQHVGWIVFPIVFFIGILPLTLSLFWGYRVHELRLDTMQQGIISSLGEDKKES